MSNKMWGGRFAASPDAVMEEINASIEFDRKLAADIAGSLAHVAMLGKDGHHLPKADALAISEALDHIRGEIEKGNFTFSRALKDTI